MPNDTENPETPTPIPISDKSNKIRGFNCLRNSTLLLPSVHHPAHDPNKVAMPFPRRSPLRLSQTLYKVTRSEIRPITPFYLQCSCTSRALSTSRWLSEEYTVKVPPMAESISEGTLSQFLKAVGEHVEMDEEIATIETDKIDVSVNAPKAGVLTKLLVQEGDVVTLEQGLAIVDTDGTPDPSTQSKSEASPTVSVDGEKPPPTTEQSAWNATQTTSSVPPAQAEVSPPGSKKQETAVPAPAPSQSVQRVHIVSPAYTTQDRRPKPPRLERVEKISRMRKTIATRLKESQNRCASLTTVQRVDMSALMDWRAKYKESVAKAHDVRLGYMGAFAKATSLAAQQVPQINASIDTEREIITYRDYVDISIAVSTPKGLVTPVIRNCESKSIIELERDVGAMAKKARDGKLTLADLEGGNYSISNPGIFGSMFGTPLINYPQAAVFNMNSIKEDVVAINGKVEIRPMMYITITYDHRLIDGREAVTFLNLVKKYIEDPSTSQFATAAGEAQAINYTRSENVIPEGGSSRYLDEMYQEWIKSPETVHESWQEYFQAVGQTAKHSTEPQSVLQNHVFPGQQSEEVLDHLKVQQIVRAYQSRGHYLAKTDPLGIRTDAELIRPDIPKPEAPNELDISYYGFGEADLDRYFNLGPGILPRFADETRKNMTLREIIAACQSIYCGSYGVEYLHIPDRAKCEWLRNRLEVPRPIDFTPEQKGNILDSLLLGTTLERFLAAKFPNEKRFGLDGAESLAPAVKTIIDHCADVHGVESIVMGSCHRGRLTMLGTVYGKPRENLFAEFAGRMRSDVLPGMAGDVKYHLGHDGECVTPEGRRVSLSLLANPSHLEAVDPVATGKAYATQAMNNDVDKKRVMCLALHGDAAFAGQGVVYETLGLSRLPAYDVGGTIRLIVNNQIGFTTDVHCSRSTSYASDIAKFVDAPIFHVNADDVEAVAFLARLAADWRAEFQTDVVIDLVCYRKFGHNELDQPSFTQPLMYQKVMDQTPSLEQYIGKLVAEGTFSRELIEEKKAKVWEGLQVEYERSKNVISERHDLPQAWKDLESPLTNKQGTAVDETQLKTVMTSMTTIPDGFEPHNGVSRVITARQKLFESNTVDWSMAEALAFGTLCLEGNAVRVTGQDVQRGTFSQRHAVWHDQPSGKSWTPLNHMSDQQAKLTIENSPLSEFGALGFEYGISLADPQSLVMWEAQFGDFANNTQVMLDNFIAAGESKWLDRSGVVLSLPHGYDGQGAEHSSARLERFLMLGDDGGRSWPSDLESAQKNTNMEIVYMTTPANYFHVLRRQLRRNYRKPLIIFFSKSLLRHPLVRSEVSELTGASAFKPVLSDPDHDITINKPEAIERVIYCSGQVYFALKKRRETLGLKDVAITRIEQLHPFPWGEVKENLELYPNARSVVWAQEEHYNGGAWHYMRDRLDTVLRELDRQTITTLRYAGRGPSASTATGLKKIHAAEEDELLNEAFASL
ncbi:unnamed protein product [Clonostachys rosea]|uniref:2-oxoglutarate dehydrogenase, mitochondrial n=1 Tax=Bionectria ochroleuca TaxID=29856 RepID=A0ABY6UCB3_BIOOC|nr:unnamed protein product [Clonostachys rosea]